MESSFLASKSNLYYDNEILGIRRLPTQNNLPFCAICPDFFTLLKPYKSNPVTSAPSARPRTIIMNFNEIAPIRQFSDSFTVLSDI